MAVLASGDAHTDGRDPVERSLRAAADAEDVTVEAGAAMVGKSPFDPDRKLMSRVWALAAGGFVVAVKGAPEAIATACAGDGRDLPVAGRLEELTGRGLRVLAFATKTTAALPATRQEVESDLRLVGWAGFEDPLRPGVVESFAALRAAGVRTLIVTGDHGATATAVAASLGADGEMLAGGPALAALDDYTLAAPANRCRRGGPGHPGRRTSTGAPVSIPGRGGGGDR